MNILVDADSCPVKDIICEIGCKYQVDTIFFLSICHTLVNAKSAIVKYVDNSYQSVDINIANHAKKGDIVVTNDYGLASLVIAKNCFCISSNGFIFDKNNISECLLSRHLNFKHRRGGYKVKGPKKRNKEDNDRFSKNLTRLIESGLLNLNGKKY